jgi:hypothetical protein
MTLDTAKSLPAHGIRLIELDIAKFQCARGAMSKLLVIIYN